MPTELTNLLLKEYTKILGTGEFSDIEILVGKDPTTKVFHLHSFILKIRSTYFHEKLSNNSVNIENNIIKFHEPNVSVRIFEILIKYIYVGKFELANNDVKTNFELLIAADELRLEDLYLYMDKYLLNDKESLKSNFALTLHIAKKFPQSQLSQFYEQTYQQDPSLIFNTGDFIKIKKEYLLELLIKDDHSLRPILVWNKLTEWAVEQPNELPTDIENWTDRNIMTFGKLIQPFIPYIKFREMRSFDFFRKVRPFKNIFDDKVYIEILEGYCFN